MSLSEFPARMGFEIGFESDGFVSISEGVSRVDSPWTKLRGVWDFASVVFCESRLQVFRQASVMAFGIIYADKAIHVVKFHFQ